ncbi:protein TolQ [bacterium]|nr:MAG: protein TolQ [bacterium]
MTGQESILSMALNSGLVVGGVLLLLVVCSIGCWAVIIFKFRVLKAAAAQNAKFLEIFWNTSSFQSAQETTDHLDKSPLNIMFRDGYREWKKFRTAKAGASADDLAISSGTIESVERSLRRALDSETTRLESFLIFLATVASAAPFVGLFGTVWGIMESFRDIGAMGTANLAVVAPGISEALIATATGLAAAIPAVVAYNYFNNNIKNLVTEMEGFRAEFLNIVTHHESVGRR